MFRNIVFVIDPFSAVCYNYSSIVSEVFVMDSLKIGWSQISITPDLPVYNGGQIYPRVSKYVHDPLYATALALDSGSSQAVLVSLDIMCVPPRSITDKIRGAVRDLEGFDPRCISFSATHTHNSIQDTPWLFSRDAIDFFGAEKFAVPNQPKDILDGVALNDFLITRVTQAIREAWQNRKDSRIATASDYAVVAFNRRPVFQTRDGAKTQMYGVCSHKSFQGFEGGSDHSIDMIYTYDPLGTLTGIAVCVPCPSQVFELHSFLTADYWYYARSAIRERLGPVPVLSLCGASGDQNPIDLVRISKYNECELQTWSAQAGEVFRNFDMTDLCRDIASRISDAVLRGYKKAQPWVSPIIDHRTEMIRLPIRKVSEQDYQKAVEIINKEKAAFSCEHPLKGPDLVRIFEPLGVYSRYLQQKRSPYVEVPLHAWRINSLVMASCPFELFVDYAFRIKARTSAEQPVVLQMTDDYLDYLPTSQALKGGSYSSAPASTTCGPESGDILVEEMLALMNDLWEKR